MRIIREAKYRPKIRRVIKAGLVMIKSEMADKHAQHQ